MRDNTGQGMGKNIQLWRDKKLGEGKNILRGP